VTSRLGTGKPLIFLQCMAAYPLNEHNSVVLLTNAGGVLLTPVPVIIQSVFQVEPVQYGCLLCSPSLISHALETGRPCI
jgi:hypothetical protein